MLALSPILRQNILFISVMLQMNNQKEETAVKLQTLDTADNVEEIMERQKKPAAVDTLKKPKKITF